MDIEEAKRIIAHLADGVNPHTGEMFPEDSPYQHPDTIRALYKALLALERWDKYERKRRPQPRNAGKPWSAAEERALADDFDRGLAIEALADKYGRTYGAIRARLVMLGKIEVPRAPDE